MKKFIVCVVFFLSLCVGFAFVSEYKSNSNVKISTECVPPQTSEASKIIPSKCVLTTPTKEYKLKEYEGNLAVFKTGSLIPIKITSIPIENLPPTDQEMLKQGIEASTEEINILLEDYGS